LLTEKRFLFNELFIFFFILIVPEVHVTEMTSPTLRSSKLAAVKVEKIEGAEPSPGPSSPRKRGRKKPEEEDDSYASAMLLDVLAQVASDRLETEPKRIGLDKRV
jgi:hypothetical protein